MSTAPAGEAREGRLAENIVYFARALRAAGIPVGPGAVLDALEAVEAAGVGEREDFYWTLHAVFVKKHEHSVLFDQAFKIFFRKRGYLDQLMAMMLPQAPTAAAEAAAGLRAHRRRRCSRGLKDKLRRQEREIEIDSRLTVSDREVLQGKDFAQMSAAEIVRAKEAIAPHGAFPRRGARRAGSRPTAAAVPLDMRRTLRASMKAGGALIDLKYRGPKTRLPPIVALLDISGSMGEYTRLFLHFLHAVTDARKRVHSFLFGTRLTNVTRALRAKDPDEALAAVLGERRRLVRRHPHRDLAPCLQQAMGAPGAHPRRDRPADHRRARTRPRRPPRLRDRSAAPLLPPPDLAQSAAALRGLRAQGPRRTDDASPCRRIPPGA